MVFINRFQHRIFSLKMMNQKKMNCTTEKEKEVIPYIVKEMRDAGISQATVEYICEIADEYQGMFDLMCLWSDETDEKEKQITLDLIISNTKELCMYEYIRELKEEEKIKWDILIANRKKGLLRRILEKCRDLIEKIVS